VPSRLGSALQTGCRSLSTDSGITNARISVCGLRSSSSLSDLALADAELICHIISVTRR
jgi:hypothetical protein